MFIEVNGRPNTVILQRWSQRNRWADVGSYTHNEGVDYVVAHNLLSGTADFFNHRLIIRGKKSKREIQVLSGRALDFYRILQNVGNSSSRFIRRANGEMYNNFDNPTCLPMKKLKEFIKSHNGIKKAKLRAITATDGSLRTWDVTFNDEHKEAFSLFWS